MRRTNPARGPRGFKGSRGLRGQRGERGQRGQAGQTGQRGERGEPGPPGKDAALEVIGRMAQQLEAVQRELRVQFTRIAQIQADLDSLRSDLKKQS